MDADSVATLLPLRHSKSKFRANSSLLGGYVVLLLLKQTIHHFVRGKDHHKGTQKERFHSGKDTEEEGTLFSVFMKSSTLLLLT